MKRPNILKDGLNVSILVISEVAAKGSLFFISYMLARRVGVENYGVFAYLINIALLSSVFFDFGFSQYLPLYLKEQRGAVPIWKLIGRLRALITILLALCYIVLVKVLAPEYTFEEIGYSVLYLISVSYNLMLVTITQYIRSTKVNFLSKILLGVTNVVGTLLLIKFNNLSGNASFFLMSLSYAVSSLLIIIFLYTDLFKQRIDGRFVSWTKESLYILRNSSRFLLISIFSVIYTRIDRVLMKYYVNFESIGSYNAYYMIIDGITVIYKNTVVFYYYNKLIKSLTPEKFIQQRRLLLIFVPILLLVLILVTFPFRQNAHLLIEIIFGQAYLADLMFIESLAFIPAFVIPSFLVSSFLLAVRQESAVYKATFVGMCVNAGAVFLILNWEPYQLGYATIISESLQLAYMYYILHMVKSIDQIDLKAENLSHE